MWFLAHAQTVAIRRSHLTIRRDTLLRIVSLGMAPFSNQVAMMLVQIVMNKSLKYYGSLSVYGESIPIACAGIITKVNQVFLSFIIGISQGLQPIVSFNYGAKKYGRVKKAYLHAAAAGFVLALTAFILFQTIPRQIISIFGSGSEEYYRFAVRYFHIFLFFKFSAADHLEFFHRDRQAETGNFSLVNQADYFPAPAAVTVSALSRH